MKQSVTISIGVIIFFAVLIIMTITAKKDSSEKSELSMISIDSPPGFQTQLFESLPNDSIFSFVARKFTESQNSKSAVMFKKQNQLFSINREEDKIIFLRIGPRGVILKTEWIGNSQKRLNEGIISDSFENEKLGLTAGKTYNLYH